MTIYIYDDYTVHARQTLSVDAQTTGYGLVFDHIGQTDLTFSNSGRVEITATAGYDVTGFVEINYTYGRQDIIWNHAGGEISVSSDQAATGFDIQNAVGSFYNDGRLTVTATSQALGGAISYDGQFANTGDVLVTGGNALGFQLTYLASAQNSGQIEVRGVTAATDLFIQSNDTTFHNDGVLLADATEGLATGVRFAYVALLDNAGEIVAGGPSSVGVSLMPEYWRASEIANSGLIKAATAIEARDGGGSTPRGVVIDNSGRIIGAITLVSGSDDIHNTGLIRGSVILGDGKDVYDGAHGRLLGSVDGGGGDDILTGGKKAEVLIGGAGGDVLAGGRGGDTFAFARLSDSTQAHADLIQDLSGADSIDLSAIDADDTRPGDQAFTLVAAFHGHAGELVLRYQPADGVTLLEADVDGDGAADMVVRIAGDHADFTHFVL